MCHCLALGTTQGLAGKAVYVRFVLYLFVLDDGSHILGHHPSSREESSQTI